MVASKNATAISIIARISFGLRIFISFAPNYSASAALIAIAHSRRFFSNSQDVS